MSQSRLRIVLGILLVVLTLAAFGHVCGNDFVNYDDPDYVTNNPPVEAGLTAGSVRWAFTSTYAANWHPLTWLSLQLDAQLYGLSAWGFHLTNLLLHAANVLLLFLVLERMTAAPWRSAMVAALFAVHPLHVESVAWIAERKDVLSTLFWMLTTGAYVLYVERPRWRRYLAVVGFFTLGLMAKPMLVTLPCVLLLLDFWPLRRTVSVWRLLGEKLSLFALTAASCVVTVVAQRQTVMPLEMLPFKFRLYNALFAYLGYAGKMFWPSSLAALYPYPRLWVLWQVAAAGLVLVVVTVVALRTARRWPYFLVGWFWYLGTLVPVVGLVQVGKQPMADRYTYIPLIGLFLVLVWGTADLVARWRRAPVVLAPLAAVVLLACTVVTWQQVRYWHNEDSLWRHTLQVTTANGDAHAIVGGMFQKRGELDKAVQQYTLALRFRPDDAEVHCTLAGILFSQGELDEAQRHFAEAVRIDPENAQAHSDLGAVLDRQGQFAEAIRHFSLAIRLKPDSALFHRNLGGLLARQGDTAGAMEHFSTAVRLDPNDAAAHCNLGVLLERAGRIEEAAAHYSRALHARPDFAQARRHLEAIGRTPSDGSGSPGSHPVP